MKYNIHKYQIKETSNKMPWEYNNNDNGDLRENEQKNNTSTTIFTRLPALDDEAV